jgi:CubicO group peptidase (beta-lactamase class C family)
MSRDRIVTVPNPDLARAEGNLSFWSHADNRRYGWHNLHRIARYGMSLRAARVMPLSRCMDLAIADRTDVRELTALPWFSAMVVVRGAEVLFERYAPDFGPSAPHSVQSISKTLMNLVIGRVVTESGLDLSRRIDHYLPDIGSGYASATVQQALDMDLVNDYTEDFADPTCTYYRHEEAMGWRLPGDPAHEITQREFVKQIRSSDTSNPSRQLQYKDANTDVLGWIAERVSNRPLRAFLADIVDAAGLEGALYMTTDRDGVPSIHGGACLTARDLARYFSLFVRRGAGIEGQQIGNAAFLEQTLASGGGVPMPEPNSHIRYHNHMMVSGPNLMHGGWGGQFVLANMDTGIVGVFLSVIEDRYAATRSYLWPIMRMLTEIAATDPSP